MSSEPVDVEEFNQSERWCRLSMNDLHATAGDDMYKDTVITRADNGIPILPHSGHRAMDYNCSYEEVCTA